MSFYLNNENKNAFYTSGEEIDRISELKMRVIYSIQYKEEEYLRISKQMGGYSRKDFEKIHKISIRQMQNEIKKLESVQKNY